MNYRHAYHAGNFADVFKHLLLLELLKTFLAKEPPFFYMETHAGIGLYHLQAEAALKTAEWKNGIGKLWHSVANSSAEEEGIQTPSEILDYIHRVEQNQPWVSADASLFSHTMTHYPGSPVLARSVLRKQDQMLLCELHPQDHALLRKHFQHDASVAVHHLDGYQGLKAFLPPKIGRGLVLIDPPFESPNEFDCLLQQLVFAVNRWKTGIFACWYPIKSTYDMKAWYRLLKGARLPEYIHLEFHLPRERDDTKLSACGLLVVRPPWCWAERMRAPLQWLENVLVR